MADTVGWDIGGVHLKSARARPVTGGVALETRLLPFEIWKDVAGLASRLKALHDGRPAAHAVTMTAELSDVFPDRASGVRAIVTACRAALPGALRVLDRQGRLVPPDLAMERPLEAAAANWMATALLVSSAWREGLLVDTGSTTTDIIPIVDHEPRPLGRSDTERLLSGELVYSGLLRTPPASLADTVPLPAGACRVAPEHFTIMADVYRLLGRIEEEEYTVPTPDGRGRGVGDCQARLARIVCADVQEIGVPAVEDLARFLERRQVERLAEGIRQVASRCPGKNPRVVSAGAGGFLAAAAARSAGLEAVPIESLFPAVAGDRWGRVAPAAALALLLQREPPTSA